MDAESAVAAMEAAEALRPRSNGEATSTDDAVASSSSPRRMGDPKQTRILLVAGTQSGVGKVRAPVPPVPVPVYRHATRGRPRKYLASSESDRGERPTKTTFE